MEKKACLILSVLLLVFSVTGCALAQNTGSDQREAAEANVIIEDEGPESEEEEFEEENGEDAKETPEVSAKDIVPYQETEVQLQPSETLYFRFVPETADQYRFFSCHAKKNADPVGYLYDENMELLYGSDDEDENVNFRIEWTLEKGKTYYFGCEIAGPEEGIYNVVLEKIQQSI